MLALSPACAHAAAGWRARCAPSAPGRTDRRLCQVALIDTPDIDGGDGGDGGDGKGWDSVDESWVVEHAKEVQRLMPGGLMVMGVFFFCPAEQVSVGGAKSSMAYSILRKIARLQAAVLGGEEEEERLLLHVCSKTKRLSCKAFQIKDASKGR